MVYEDGKVLNSELAQHIRQKPNKKFLYLFPLGLWTYNLANPKYDTILEEYNTYQNEIRNQALRDSLFVKYNHPEYKGKSIFLDRLLHKFGSPPVILSKQKTEQSTINIENELIYRGYWRAKVSNEIKLDSATQKAQVKYFITHNKPTYIKEYHYNISDENIKKIYEEELNKSYVKTGKILDQKNLELEVARLTELMRKKGYYHFNYNKKDIYFTADTLSSREEVPLTIDIHKDSLETPYKKSTFGNIDVGLVKDIKQYKVDTYKDTLNGINFYKLDNQYKTKALWKAITIKPGKVYSEKDLNLSKRILQSMDNFRISSTDELRGNFPPNDSIVDVSFILTPLPKYETKYGLDVNYSQILNLGISPSFDLTTRNIFGGAENLYTGISGRFGILKSSKDIEKNTLAYELSANANLRFPRLLLPINTENIFLKRYAPSTIINLGVSKQQNIGLGRLNVNTGLEYVINIDDRIQHKLTLFNINLSLTEDKNKYYDYFASEREVRDKLYQQYSPNLFNDFQNGLLSNDEFTNIILNDSNFINNLSGSNLNSYNDFLQSLINKDRQTQDVLISSIIYDFTYNEMGVQSKRHPFFFNGKLEIAGNLLSFLRPKSSEFGITTGEQKTIFNVPYSQFIKLDLDFRKHFKFGQNTLALRQFIGIGIPYGNSNSMPFVRSYFNGGSSDIRAWRAFEGLGPADSQLDQKVRAYLMENMKLTTNIEYRMPLNSLFEGALFTDIGNIWSTENKGLGNEFKFNKFLGQLGVGSGFGIRLNIMNIIGRLDFAYKIYDPNQQVENRWRFNDFKILQPRINFAIGYPF